MQAIDPKYKQLHPQSSAPSTDFIDNPWFRHLRPFTQEDKNNIKLSLIQDDIQKLKMIKSWFKKPRVQFLWLNDYFWCVGDQEQLIKEAIRASVSLMVSSVGERKIFIYFRVSLKTGLNVAGILYDQHEGKERASKGKPKVIFQNLTDLESKKPNTYFIASRDPKGRIVFTPLKSFLETFNSYIPHCPQVPVSFKDLCALEEKPLRQFIKRSKKRSLLYTKGYICPFKNFPRGHYPVEQDPYIREVYIPKFMELNNNNNNNNNNQQKNNRSFAFLKFSSTPDHLTMVIVKRNEDGEFDISFYKPPEDYHSEMCKVSIPTTQESASDQLFGLARIVPSLPVFYQA
ncbi:hypothetical protein DFA_05349 [Cavenderia fasciculata]|uniref:Uncharacterized protein n=1 Tax=Cavenderia fasciculata TaxID=261658 RepID=F4PKZ5_CACFS|nr:uncharacterized protein DFA_05349 [Cavenderia fasciculata]EGG23217.1 hypothetical protein DFA_05349 [Cavenderia fasciculata]|eukprot:XP_004361068.1 hypothetical protein DFA_05349 [Cavenderia fasciculata]